VVAPRHWCMARVACALYPIPPISLSVHVTPCNCTLRPREILPRRTMDPSCQWHVTGQCCLIQSIGMEWSHYPVSCDDGPILSVTCDGSSWVPYEKNWSLSRLPHHHLCVPLPSRAIRTCVLLDSSGLSLQCCTFVFYIDRWGVYIKIMSWCGPGYIGVCFEFSYYTKYYVQPRCSDWNCFFTRSHVWYLKASKLEHILMVSILYLSHVYFNHLR
jgi:hypothetical protein